MRLRLHYPDSFELRSLALFPVLLIILCIYRTTLLSYLDTYRYVQVIPVYKSFRYIRQKSRVIFTNYRPISLLSNISKILEKVVHKRLYGFVTKHEILYDGQYGFRPKHSTIDALTEFVSNALPALDTVVI